MRSPSAQRLAVLLCFVVVACSTRDTNLANSRVVDFDAGVAPDASADATAMYRFDDAGVVFCGVNRACACSDGVDNDGDNRSDGLDPECTGAFDDFEDSFATGRHGEDQTTRRQDCFYDSYSGGGDGCGRARCCSLVDPITPGNSGCKDCAVDPTCSETCGPLVPNGCDCFGCCGVWRDGVVSNVLLGSASCTLATLSACTRCIPATECQNPCGPCELCPGRGLDDLPLTCAEPGGPGYSCDNSLPCLSSADCGMLGYCQHGCCILTGV
jgi:hypothetical protein